MAKALQTDLLLQSVGASVSDRMGEHLGNIAEITRNHTDKNIEYVILKSSVCFGRGDRFFAVPASSNLIEINDNGNISFQLNKDDLQFAKGVSADKCPKPDLKRGKSVYELYKYQVPEISPHGSSTNVTPLAE